MRQGFLLLVLLLVGTFSRAQTTYYSKAIATDFNAVGSWGENPDGSGGAPAALSVADEFVVANAAALSLTGNANVGKLKVSSGSLTVNAWQLMVSLAGVNNSTLLVNGGTLNLSGTGAIVLNGNFSMTSGALNQTGGSMAVDGNAGNVAASSVASGTALFAITGGGGGSTAGTITIVDPPVSSYAALSTLTIRFALPAAPLFTGTHTFVMGDGSSTTTGNSDGFSIETAGTGRIYLQNLTVNGGAAAGRSTTTTNTSTPTTRGVYVRGLLTVNAGSEFAINPNASGASNWTVGSILNNGIVTTGTASLQPTLRIGVVETTISSTPASISGAGLFRNRPSGATAAFGGLIIGNSAGVSFAAGTLNNAVYPTSITTVLTLEAGRVNLNGQTIGLGESITNQGTFSLVSGGFYNGSIKRWTGTSNSIQFPFVDPVNGASNNLAVSYSSGTSGGTMTATTNSIPGLAPASLVDGTYTVNQVSNTTWSVSTDNGFNAGTASFTVNITGEGIMAMNSSTSTTAPRVVTTGGLVGSHVSPAGTPYAPVAKRGSLSALQLTGNTFQIGINSSDLAIATVTSGPWEATTTWQGGTVPTASTSALILNGHAVTVSTTTAAAANLYINAGGSLAVSGSTLTISGATRSLHNRGAINLSAGNLNVGTSGNASSMTNDGTFDMSGGILTVRGNLSAEAASIFSQSGGDIEVDGNSGSTTTSVLDNTPVVALKTTALSLTGGLLMVTDPHAVTANTTLLISGSTSVSPIVIGTGHTFRIGDGSSGNAGGDATNGAKIDAGLTRFGNLEISGSSGGSNRFVTGTASLIVMGNVAIGTYGELRASIVTVGNITNNGTLVTTGTLTLGAPGGLPATAAQTITGTGSFENSATGGSYNFNALTVNNTSAAGVTFASSNSVLPTNQTGTALTLNLMAGKVTGSASRPFVVGTLNYTSGGFAPGTMVGRFLPTATATGLGQTYPFISNGDSRFAYINVNASTTGGMLACTYNDAAGLASVSLIDGSYTVNKRTNASWTFSYTVSGYTGLASASDNVTVSLAPGNLLTLATSPGAAPRVMKASTFPATHVAGSGSSAAPIASRSGTLNNFTGGLYVGANNADVVGVQTAQSGPWENPVTWVGGVVPGVGDNAQIRSGHNVIVNGAAASANTLRVDGTLAVTGNVLSITSGSSTGLDITGTGSVSITAGTVNVNSAAAANYRARFTNNGIFSISGGTMNVYGSLASMSGSVFAQSGGAINVDGNKDGTGANSVPPGTHLVAFYTSGLELSGGVFTIVDPHVGSNLTLDYSFVYDAPLFDTAGANHVFRFGNGVSTDASYDQEFSIQPNAGTGLFSFGGFEVDALNVQRSVAVELTLATLGDITIHSGSWLVSEGSGTANSLYAAGSIINNGTLKSYSDVTYFARYINNVRSAATRYQVIGGTGVYMQDNSSNTNFRALWIQNSNDSGVLFATHAALQSTGNSYTVSGNLNLQGKVSTGTDTFYLSNQSSSLTHGGGGNGFTSGSSLKRYYTTSNYGTPIAVGTAPTSTLGKYPFVTASGQDRTLWFQRSNSGSGPGSVAVTFVDAPGTSPVNFQDGIKTITKRSNAQWSFRMSDGYNSSSALSGHKIAISASGLYVASNGQSRIAYANAAIGTSLHLDGTTTPVAQREALTFAELSGAPLYVAYDTSDVAAPAFISVQSGDWHNPSTWDQNAVPTALNNATIMPGHTVTVNGTPGSGKDLTVLAGGTLQVNGSTLNLAGKIINSGTVNAPGGAMNVAGGNAVGITNNTGAAFTVSGGTVTLGPTANGANYSTFKSTAGSLTVSSGTLRIFGNLSIVSATAFTQSGGLIEIDGNAAGVEALSVSYFSPIADIVAGNNNFSAGVFRIVDPSASSNTSAVTLTASSPIPTGTHRLELGDGVSVDPGGSASGMLVYANAKYLVVNGSPGGINKHVKYSGTVTGRINVGNNAELRYTGGITFKGDSLWVESGGILTSTGTLTMQRDSVQFIGGAGLFRNSETNPTATLTTLVVNHTDTVGVKLLAPQSVSNGLTLLNGFLHTSNTNLLTVVDGTISGGNSTTYVKGPMAVAFEPGLSSATQFYSFPVGKTAYAPITIAPTTNSFGSTVLKAEVFDGHTGSAGTGFININAGRRWETSFVSGASGFTGGKVRLGDPLIISTSGVGVATSANGVYNLQPSAYTGATPNITTTNSVIPSAGFTGFFAHGEQYPLVIQSITAVQQTGYINKGSSFNNLMRLDFNLTGTVGTIALDQLLLTYTGTNPADIAANGMRLYDGDATSPNNLLGAAQSLGAGVATFSTLNKSLVTGMNYVWVVINTAPTSTVGNQVDVKVNAGDMSFTTTGAAMVGAPVPATALDPAGSREINYCAPLYSTGCANGNHISNVVMGTLSNASGCSTAPDFYTFYSNLTQPILEQGTTMNISVTMGPDATQYAGVWVDFNQDGVFDNLEGFTPNTNAGANGTVIIPIVIPANAVPGVSRLRVRGGNNNVMTLANDCGSTVSAVGETEDYAVTISAAIPRTITSVTATQITGLVGIASTDNPVLRVSVPVTGTAGTISLNSLQLAYSGTQVADIATSGIKFWTGSATAPLALIGTPQSIGTGTVNFTGLTTALDTGANYFWLTTDIAGTAMLGNTVDFLIPSGNMVFSSTGPATAPGVQPATTQSPAGNRVIDYCIPVYSFGCGTGNEITNVTLGTLNNSSGCSAGPEFYTRYNLPAVPVLAEGNTYNVSVTMGGDITGQFAGVWVDFNNNKYFEAGEGFVSAISAGANGTAVIPVTIPAGTAATNVRMRVRGGNDAAMTTAMACGTSSSNYGETEDYVVGLTTQTCATVTLPSSAATVASTANVCGTANVTLTIDPVIPASAGLQYQWQRSIDNGATYTNLGSAGTASQYVASVTASAMYQALVLCNATTVLTAAPVTVTFAQPAIPGVTIAASPGTTVCAGTPITFTAVPVNGGGNPVYQWKKNGTNVGTNNSTFTSSSFASNDVITCSLTSSLTCTTVSGATSNALSVTIDAAQVPTVSIVSSAGSSICPGAAVTFTATPSAGGSTPSYQWKLNGVNAGGNAATFSSSGLLNSDVISCVMTSSAACASPATATSNNITMTVVPAVTPSLSIAANGGTTICSGTNLAFTATATNGGSTPSYQWKKNGVNTGTNSATFIATGLSNGDVIGCVMTSNAPCASPATATASPLTITVTPLPSPAVSVSATPAGAVCAGTVIAFTATPAAGGPTPAYQWKKNGVNAGTNSSIYSGSTFANGDIVVCEMTSNAICAPATPVVSSAITLTVTTPSTPTVSVAASPAGSICAGTPVTFTSTAAGAGAGFSYQWKKNGSNVGTNSATYTDNTLVNSDAVTCVISTAVGACVTAASATSTAVVMTVNPVVTPTISIAANGGTSICSGNSITFTATIANGGSTPFYQWKKNGVDAGTNSATFIATGLSNSDVIGCILTSNAPCTGSATATASPLTITVTPVPVPTVSVIAFPAGAICAGTTVTFTATPAAGGSQPVYQWKKNGVNAGTNSSIYSGSTFANGDIIVCEMTSNVICAPATPVVSSAITLTVTTPSTPTVSVAASPAGSICAGTPVTFTSTAAGAGTGFSYQWKKNGSNVGTNSATYTDNALVNSDAVTCVISTAAGACVTAASATSTAVVMTVNPVIVPTLSIATASTSVCMGSGAGFTATTNATNAAYQWKVNSVNVGTNSATYAYQPGNGDVVSCTIALTGCYLPASLNSNTLTMSTLQPSVPIAHLTTPDTSICAGMTALYTLSTNVVGGTYQWQVNGNNVGSSTSLSYSYVPANGDVIQCLVTTMPGSCYTVSAVPSGSIVMAVAPQVASTIVLSAQATAAPGSQVTVLANVSNTGGTYFIQWSNNGNLFATTAVPSVVFTKSVGTDAITAVLIPDADCHDNDTATAISIAENVGVAGTPDGRNITTRPNPFTNAIVVENLLPGDRLRLMDITGRQVASMVAGQAGTVQFILPDLAAGSYQLVVSDSTGHRYGTSTMQKR